MSLRFDGSLKYFFYQVKLRLGFYSWKIKFLYIGLEIQSSKDP